MFPQMVECGIITVMKTNAILSLAAAIALAGCTSSSLPYRESGTDFAAKALAPWVEKGELAGAISVFYNNGVQETACIGYADVEAKRPISMDNVYMQCSQTKGFCGVTVAMLVEEGKLNLDDPVSKYLPEFGQLWVQESASNGVRRLVKAKNVLTVRMVMNHTGGFAFELPSYREMGGWSRRMPLRSVAAMAAALPLLFDPGTKVQYSNVGIDIGAAVVEVVSGKRWEDFLQERVLNPLGMESSGFWPTDGQLADKIELYEVKGGSAAKWLEYKESMARPYNDDRVFSSAGAGLWTTASDQLKFYKMLMNLGMGENGVRILKEETVKNLLARSTRPENLGGYSLGLKAPVVDGEDEWFGHGGAWGTNCMVNWHKRQLKLWVVQNSGRPRPWEKARNQAADEFFKTKIDNSGIDAYTGRMK
jgi:CubicO group peptidase (beta-lactamase class C family)